MKTPFTTRFCIAVLAAVLCSFGLNAQGPNAPEAGSFEPVDATDMVSLLTGDLTYVLPLMNVPSPEGGYPIALAYHAGIAVDQEASWAGLGWNLNPGAINRTVNGYPDDYNNAVVSEYYYDRGETITSYSASVSVGITGTGISFAQGASWGSHKSLSGFISINLRLSDNGPGVGITLNSNGDVGASVGFQIDGGLTIGINANTNGTVGGSIDFVDTNGGGFSIGANNQGSTFFGASVGVGNNNIASLDFSISSNGVGINAGFKQTTSSVTKESGIGIFLSHHTAIGMGNYVTENSSFLIPLMIPIGPITLGGSFGKSTFTYYLANKVNNNISGPLYYKDYKLQTMVEVLTKRRVYYDPVTGLDYQSWPPNSTSSIQPLHRKSYSWVIEGSALESNESLTGKMMLTNTGFMDSYEISVAKTRMVNTNLEENNLIFPAYDKYHVQAQGLSGNISPRLYENGAIIGISNKGNNSYTVDYGYEKYSNVQEIPASYRFTSQPQFVFDNEISSYLGTAKVNFDNKNNIINDLEISFTEDQDDNGIIDAGGHRKTANHVRYFTKANMNAAGYLKTPQHDYLSNIDVPEDAIMGFQITASDGKIYHYSLPVFNHEIISRTFGVTKNLDGVLNPEWASYFEKRQLTPFATHWLLTAVTGPDYVDNGDGVADTGDLGYWVRMDYGLWSDAFVWKSPMDKLYFENPNDSDKKTWIRGRKQVYYLNSIKTRTHTALFEKSERNEKSSSEWKYYSTRHVDSGKLTEEDKIYKLRFKIDEQASLKLDRVLLFKNTDIDQFSLTAGNQENKKVTIDYEETGVSSRDASFLNFNNVVDSEDSLEDYIAKAQKVVTLEQKHLLQEDFDPLTAVDQWGNPLEQKRYPGKPHLQKVVFKGKGGVAVLPPYFFSYNSPLLVDLENIKNADNYGYYKTDNTLGSLTSIKTPQGSSINFKYETHKFSSAIVHSYNFSVNNNELDILKQGISYDLLLSAEIKSAENIGIKIGDRLTATINLDVKESVYMQTGTHSVYRDRKIDLRVTEKIDENHYKVESREPILYPSEFYSNNGGLSVSDYSLNVKNILFTSDEKTIYTDGGPRVASISIEDGEHQTSTQYTYGSEEAPHGYVSYHPEAPDLMNEVPYTSELPAPKVLYEYTQVNRLDKNEVSQGKTQYHFNVLKSKDPDKIKFGDFYEIIYDKKQSVVNNLNKQISVGNFTIKDAIASIGQLLSVTSFNKEAQITNEVQNEYFEPSESPDQMGITQESFQSYKNIDYQDANKKDQWIISASTRIKYPNLIKRTINKANTFSSETSFSNFNPLTGSAETILTKDYKGNQIKSTSLPAYKAYPGSWYGMGSKFEDSTNKNMLSQTAQTATYIEKNGVWKPLSVGISTWKKWDPEHYIDEENLARKQVWRKHQTYVWDGPLDADGAYASFEGADDQFNWTSETQTNSRWRAVQTTTRYDAFSKPLEQRDINNNYSSIHRGDGDTKTLAAVNAPYTAYACHGFEYSQGFSGGSQTSKKAHTGSYGLEISQGSPGVSIVSIGGKYQLSVWVEKGKEAELRVSENGTLKELNGETITAGVWVQRTHYLDLDSGSASIGLSSASGSMIIDDFRLLPISSQATTYVYNQWDELSYILGANNMATHYTYTPSGKLETTATEVADAPGLVGGFKKTAQHQYNYKNALE